MTCSRTRCLIGFGGNQGDVPATFDRAVALLQQNGCLVQQTSCWRTSAPMGPEAGAPFVNGAAVVLTSLSAEDLLLLLLQIEDLCGRVRTVHWGPRTLDLDLLFYGDQVLSSDCLTVPHPGLWYRRFVLEPAEELDPQWQHPELGLSVRQLRERLDRRPLIIGVPEPLLGTPVPASVRLISLQEAELLGDRVFCRLQPLGGNSSTAAGPSRFVVTTERDDCHVTLESILAAALGE